VPQELERELFERYCEAVAAREPAFERTKFAAAYADFGAQRNTRLLGLWLRLLKRDGKPHYVQNIPRTWGYLERNLEAPALEPLAAWYDRHFPQQLRFQQLPQ
jgi:N-acetylmuramate 1-kinase